MLEVRSEKKEGGEINTKFVFSPESNGKTERFF